MSLLMYSLADQGVTIMTDTLATSAGQPHLFMSKATIVPHLDMAIAFTGIGQLGTRWQVALQENILARNIDTLDIHAPAVLRKLFADLLTEADPAEATATVYHFGRGEISGAYVGFAYRSTNDFESEPLAVGGFGIKPVPLEPFEVPEAVEEWVDLAQRVRAEQHGLPESQRIYVGGALRVLALSVGAIVSFEASRFEDYDDQWLEMNGNLPR